MSQYNTPGDCPRISRRALLAGGAASGVAAMMYGAWPHRAVAAVGDGSDRPRRILFASRGRAAAIDENGRGERYIAPDVPDQVSWQWGPRFADGRHAILLSVEGKKTWEHNVRSHLWKYDLDTGDFTELATENPPAVFMPACALIDGDQRLVVNPIIDGEQRVMTMNLDGSDQVPVTGAGDGFTYGVSVSPDQQRLAFHATGPHEYRIFTTQIDGSDRRLVAGADGHLYFGPTWSHDGEWLLYLDCHTSGGPGHDWADLAIGRPDGSEHRVVTVGQRHWFGTSFGGPDTRGSGSNMPQWSPRENVCTFTCALPGARTAWQYASGRPDTDHFNREYQPELARGGTEICLLDPLSGDVSRLTHSDPPVWDFRTTFSADGERIAFCRAAVGAASELWIMNTDGSDAHRLTQGYENLGADHPVWMT
ncbi:MAG: PD40 domain-containing protein [Planctomycetales bacterium]|nr:PD40 domain-containing protein [Planctomycetales bacterium]